MSKMDIHKKESLFLDYPDIISYNCIQTLLEQMENCVCEIEAENKIGTGHFCKIPFPDINNQLPVLITNNHVINEKLLSKPNAKIIISTKNETKPKEIFFHGRKRITFSEEEYDITIIEIKKEDNIKNFMELDDTIINDIIKDENSNYKFQDQSIYIIQYPKKILSVSFGRIGEIKESKNYQIIHRCNTEKGSSGSPIVKLNNKIIGVHKWGESKSERYNCGTFLTEPVKKFIEKYSHTNKRNKISNAKKQKNLTPEKSLFKDRKNNNNINSIIIPQHITNVNKDTTINIIQKNQMVNDNNNNKSRPLTPKKNPILHPIKFLPLIKSPIPIVSTYINSNIIKGPSCQKFIDVSKSKYRKNIEEINKIYGLRQPMEFIKYIINNYKYKNFVNSEDLFKNKSLEKIIDIISPEYNPDYYHDRDDVGIYNEIFLLLALIKANIKN